MLYPTELLVLGIKVPAFIILHPIGKCKDFFQKIYSNFHWRSPAQRRTPPMGIHARRAPECGLPHISLKSAADRPALQIILIFAGGLPELRHAFSDGIRRLIDLFHGIPIAKGQAEGSPGHIVRQSHGGEYMGRMSGAGAAGRTGGGADSLFIQKEQKRRSFHKLKTDAAVPCQAVTPASVETGRKVFLSEDARSDGPAWPPSFFLFPASLFAKAVPPSQDR